MKFLVSVTDGVLDACSDNDKGILVALDFGNLFKSEDLVSEEESVVVTSVVTPSILISTEAEQ